MNETPESIRTDKLKPYEGKWIQLAEIMLLMDKENRETALREFEYILRRLK